MKVDDYIENAAEEFIQTAVFVDDRIYEPGSGAVKAAPLKPVNKKLRKPAIASNKENENDAHGNEGIIENNEVPEGSVFSSRDLINSFAKKRIVCSLYEPSKEAKYSMQSDVCKLCLASDVVILDWVLHGDNGGHTLDLIDQLLKQSLDQDPEQLRLILIYTDEPNLNLVADRIFGKIKELVETPDDASRSSSELALHTSNTRIMVYGKPNSRRDPKYMDFVIPESELADATIREFSKLADGLLQANVLNGLAAIKKNSRKILTKFNSELDSAFLTHRALSLPHDEASEHLTNLIVSEIEAILEDKMSIDIGNSDLLYDWVDKKWNPANHTKEFLKEKVCPKEFAKAFLVEGPAVKKIAELSNKFASEKDGVYSWELKDADKVNQIATFLLSSEDNNENVLFSHLMSHRTHYSEERHLSLGTIIRKIKDSNYFLCLQPSCDCVRLKEKTDFPLLRLYKRDKGEKFDLVIHENEERIFLRLGTKPKDLVIETFAPDRKKQIVRAAYDKNKFIFKDSGYDWVAQLKPIHAQREAVKISSQLARVGVSESEWQRLMT